MEPYRVLIIDDDPGVRKSLGDILKVKGYDPLAAKDGGEGLTLLKEYPVHVVIIDLILPDIPGLQVLDRIKADYAEIEAIILTGHASIDSAIAATNANAFSYMIKPYDIDQLILHIQRAIEKQEARKREFQSNRALRESEEMFRALIDTANDAIITIDAEGTILIWNKAAERIFGYTAEEAVGKNASLIIPDGFQEQHFAGMDNFKTTGEGPFIGKTVQVPALGKDGLKFPVELSVSAVKIKNEWRAVGIVRDISEEQRAQVLFRLYGAK